MNTDFKKSILPFAVSVLLAVGLFVTHIMGKSNDDFFSIPKVSALQEIKTIIAKRYLEAVNADTLTATTIDSVLMNLDPHSRYITPSEKQTELEGIKGMFYGIGVEYTLINDSVNVVQVLDKSPAQEAGLQIGDIILKAGDSSVSGASITAQRIKLILTGERGSKILIIVKRAEKILQLSAQRKEVDVNSVDAAFIISPGIGYIKLNRFTTKTYREFMTALMVLKKQPLNKLILDLRDNGGGVLEEAVEIADEFLEGDKLISYTQGFHSPKKQYRCRRLGQFEEGKLIILSNENSASASEILMGALQDWDRATIVGKRSFGKGLLQEQYNLNDGGALRLTIAKYYTPLGRSIQRNYTAGKQAYYNGAKSHLSDTNVRDKRQLTLTKSGKKLFDQSGISPDVLVESDSAIISLNLLSILNDDASKNFGYRYFVRNKTIKTQYGNFEVFQKTMTVDDKIWNFYKQSLSAKNSILLSQLSSKDKEILGRHLKTSLAAQLYGRQGYYRSLALTDQAIKKAVAL